MQAGEGGVEQVVEGGLGATLLGEPLGERRGHVRSRCEWRVVELVDLVLVGVGVGLRPSLVLGAQAGQARRVEALDRVLDSDFSPQARTSSNSALVGARPSCDAVFHSVASA